MTGELHGIIVCAGMAALKQLPREEQIKLVGHDFPNLDNLIEYVKENPWFESEENERAMEIIRRAAAKMEGKVESNA
jgi:hypothetical protein